MHIKSIVSDEDREELERMLSLGFIIPNQLFKTRQKSRMIGLDYLVSNDW